MLVRLQNTKKYRMVIDKIPVTRMPLTLLHVDTNMMQ